ncbi:TPA: AAA family ATPase [Candidatus Poribacteria bacterium]|nr:AAA family ATPase [Candidatus Poribacteria bacterium]HIO78499.1 AAA family ATPase [Candidatus Poribacteria bacterium]
MREMPSFFDRIAKEYKAGSAHMFMLHYNTYDLAKDAEHGYLPTFYYLMEQLNMVGCDIVLGYTPSQGIIWPQIDHWKWIQRSLGLVSEDVKWVGEMQGGLPSVGQFDGQGTFIAEELGLGRIRASVGNVRTESPRFRITDDQIEQLEISPQQFEIESGQKIRLKLTGFDGSNRPIGIQQARWKVEGGIGDITPDGVFTASKAGKGKITVQVHNVNAESDEIVVIPGELTKIKFEEMPREIKPREPYKFKLAGEDSSGNPVEIEDAQWEIVSEREVDPHRTKINSGVIHEKMHEDPFIGSGKLPITSDWLNQLNTLFNTVRYKVGLVMFYTEKVAPSGEMSVLPKETTTFLDTLQRWAADFDIRLKKHLFLMVAHDITDVHPVLTKNSDVPVVEIPFPDYNDRFEFINHLISLPVQTNPDSRAQITTQIKLHPDLTIEQAARDTAGLTLFGIHDVALRAEEVREPITPTLIAQYRRENVETHSRGLLEVVPTPYDRSVVGGMRHVGEIMRDIMSAIHQGDLKRAPRGLLLLGPPGTGKTLLAQMIARYSGLTFVRLKSPREWIGIERPMAGDGKSYQSDLRMALSFVQAVIPVIVFVDEIDLVSNPHVSNGVQTPNSMLPAELTNMISDPEYHGKILWIGASNRPDAIDPVFRQRGIFDHRLILLRPTGQERADILEKLFRKHQISVDGIDFSQANRATRRLSGGDLERIVLRSYNLAKRHEREVVSQEDLNRTIDDYVPEHSPEMNEFMGLLALREANSRSMVPPNLPHELREYVDGNRIDKQKISRRLQELKNSLDIV